MHPSCTAVLQSNIFSTDKDQKDFHPKRKIYFKCTQPQAIPDVDEFVCSSEQTWRILEITRNPHHSSPSVNVFWNESCLFNTVNPSRCFNFKQAFYLWKKHLIWIRRKICPDQALFKSKNSSKQISVDFDVRGQQGTDFFTGRSVIIDYGLVFCPEAKQILQQKFINEGFASYKCAAFCFTRY